MRIHATRLGLLTFPLLLVLMLHVGGVAFAARPTNNPDRLAELEARVEVLAAANAAQATQLENLLALDAAQEIQLSEVGIRAFLVQATLNAAESRIVTLELVQGLPLRVAQVEAEVASVPQTPIRVPLLFMGELLPECQAGLNEVGSFPIDDPEFASLGLQVIARDVLQIGAVTQCISDISEVFSTFLFGPPFVISPLYDQLAAAWEELNLRLWLVEQEVLAVP